MLISIKGTAEEGVVKEGVVKEAVKDTIEEGMVKGVMKLIGGYPAIVARVLIIKVT